jgi:uncharacterized membrane protein YphA (DoxX/SURF4 family)
MTTPTKPLKILNIALWTAQVILAGMFLMAGVMKSVKPIEELVVMMPWVSNFSSGTVRFIGVSEFLGGIGLILPAWVRIKPVLTPIAALGLVVVMAFAAIYHFSKGEYSAIAINFILASIALFITWGRYKKVPIAQR